MPFRFRVRWIPLIATLLVAALGIVLGNWQTHRAEEKLAIQAKMATREHAAPITVAEAPSNVAEAEYRHVTLRGTFIPEWVSYLENRPYNGVSGFYVLMPFKLADSNTAILVARGWVPRDPGNRTKLPPIQTSPDIIQIEGVIRRDAGHVLQLGHAEAPRPGVIMQNLDIDEFAKASQLKLAPFLVEQTGGAADGLVRDWPLPSLGIDRHRGYAVQWYALALMALLFFVVTGFRRGTK